MVAIPLPAAERPGPVLVAGPNDPNAGLARRRLKVSEYEQLAASGAFDGEKVELLFGEILPALSNFPHYWVFDLEQRLIRIHSDPRDGEYRLLSTVVPGQGSTLAVPDFPDIVIEVDPLFARLFPEGG